MTLPPVIRIFFALDLPVETKENIGKFISALKKKSKSNAIRWAKADNLHITLQFLPEVRSEHLTHLITNVHKEIEGVFENIRLTFGSLHLFPNPYRPRVIVLEVLPQDQLGLLSSVIGQAITKSNYAIETRPFRAHLTLGRIKLPQDMHLTFLTEIPPPVLDLDVSEVVLFRSEPELHGSKYTVIDRIALKTTCLN